jgi:hypothetical protein
MATAGGAETFERREAQQLSGVFCSPAHFPVASQRKSHMLFSL